jgi:hypothetical protein
MEIGWSSAEADQGLELMHTRFYTKSRKGKILAKKVTLQLAENIKENDIFFIFTRLHRK